MTVYSGVSRVTQGALYVKDRDVLPPDRPIFRYSKKNGDGTTTDVIGTWGDYLRDREMGIAVDPNVTPVATEANNPRGALLITDLYQGIPDRTTVHRTVPY